MATGPNTQAILTAIVGYLQSAQVNGQPAYNTVLMGGIKDPINEVPAATVMLATDSSQHYTSGGGILERQTFRIRSIVTYDNSTDAQADETQIIAIRDAIVPIFQTHTTLGGVQGVQDSRIKDGSGSMAFMNLSGQWYRVHEINLVVTQRYNVPLGVA